MDIAIMSYIVAIVTTIISWTLFQKWKANRASAPLPPGPRGFPIIGYIPFLGTHLHKTFTELAQIHGPIYKFWLGTKLCVVISSPSLVKEISRDQDTIFANRDPPITAAIASYGCKDIAFSPYGPDWKNTRRLFVNNMMSKSSLDASYALRKQEIRRLITSVYNRSGERIDFGELASSGSISVMQNLLWGSTVEVDGETDVNKESRALLVDLMYLMGAPNVSDLFPALGRFDLQGLAKRSEEIRFAFEKIIDKAIHRHKNVKEPVEVNSYGKKNFLQILLELHDSTTSFTMDHLKAVIFDLIIGGNDTTTTVVEWTMAELMKNPDVMNKVQEELNEVVGSDNIVEENHLSKLQYLDAVVKETLRLHPAVPLLVPRCPSQTAVVGGYTVPKGARVFLNIWAIHRDPQFWEHPLEFRPQRFLDDMDKFDYLGNNLHYMPFGCGRRICPGIPLAERMVKFSLASLLQSFEWILPNDIELELCDRFGLVIKKLNPLIIIPKPKLSNLELYS